MLVETADAAAVAMRITRAEWAALREADIRAAVDPNEGLFVIDAGSRPGQV